MVNFEIKKSCFHMEILFKLSISLNFSFSLCEIEGLSKTPTVYSSLSDMP